MSNSKKKKYFAQMSDLDPNKHMAKYFDSPTLAIQWLHDNGGGTLKKRFGKMWEEVGIYCSGEFIFL